jgi:hypothetical protein
MGFFASLLRPLSLIVGNEAIGIYDSCAMLAVADMATKAGRLTEGDPTLDLKTVLKSRSPTESAH